MNQNNTYKFNLHLKENKFLLAGEDKQKNTFKISVSLFSELNETPK
jgi:hypothetical protein